MMYVENNNIIDIAYMLSGMLTAVGDMLSKFMIVLKFLLKFSVGI